MQRPGRRGEPNAARVGFSAVRPGRVSGGGAGPVRRGERRVRLESPLHDVLMMRVGITLDTSTR
jgi:hypothetical protein